MATSDYDDYDFACAGSPVHNGLAVGEIITVLRKAPSKKEIPHEKIVPGPQKGIVFATYSGAHLGPREAELFIEDKLEEIAIRHPDQ